MNKKNILMRACPVCRNISGAEILHTQKFVLPDSHPLPVLYDIIACDKCGFVYADTPATQDDYDKYYAEMSKYDMNYDCSDTLVYIDRAAWINAFISNKTDSIIDIGCGNGQLLLELQKNGLSDLTGVDPSEKCILDLQKSGISGITSSIFTFYTQKKYDYAILSGVLEHICDVEKIIDTVKQLLKIDGSLFVCVPDASRYYHYDSVAYDYFNIEHINHFDEISLINLGLRHGFSMDSLLKTTATFSKTVQPMIFSVYKNERKPAADWHLYSRKCMIDYVKNTNKNVIIDMTINGLAETKEEIVVWGAGNYTSRLLATSNLEKCNIVFFVDNDKHKQGASINGRMVYAPTAIIGRAKNATIVVAAAVFYEEIIIEAKKLGLNNKIIVLK